MGHENWTESDGLDTIPSVEEFLRQEKLKSKIKEAHQDLIQALDPIVNTSILRSGEARTFTLLGVEGKFTLILGCDDTEAYLKIKRESQGEDRDRIDYFVYYPSGSYFSYSKFGGNGFDAKQKYYKEEEQLERCLEIKETILNSVYNPQNLPPVLKEKVKEDFYPKLFNLLKNDVYETSLSGGERVRMFLKVYYDKDTLIINQLNSNNDVIGESWRISSDGSLIVPGGKILSNINSLYDYHSAFSEAERIFYEITSPNYSFAPTKPH